MEENFISLHMDTTLKYLWKNSVTKKWFNEIILVKVGVDLTDYVLVDGSLILDLVLKIL